MGWWKKRSSAEIKVMTGAHHCLESDRLVFPGGMQVCASLNRNGTLGMLESEMPGIRRCLYYWFEPGTKGELIGEMLSSWPGGARRHEAERPEEDS